MRGLRARGGYEVDVTWVNGRLTKARLHASQPGVCALKLPAATGTVAITEGRKQVAVRQERGVASFDVRAGATYFVSVGATSS